MLNFNLLFGENLVISTSPDLNSLTKKWSVEYQRLHPDVKISIIDNANLNFISDKSEMIKHKLDWSMVVGRDITVPIMNSKNPLINDIKQKGMTLQDLNTITKNKTLSDVQNDPSAIAFCKLIDISNMSNIILVPIDKNGNGKIDFMEDIYGDTDSFSRGVWIGKYPKSLSNSIYLVSSKKPNSKEEIAFINWLLTDGQKFLNSNGYSDLAYNEQQSELNKLNETFVVIEKEQYATTNIIFLCIIVFVIAVFLITISFKYYKKVDNVIDSVGISEFFNDQSIIIPKGLYFDKTHTWAFMEKDGSVKLGIDDFIQHVTGKLTRIEMKKVGDKIRKSEELLTIVQNGKHLNIYSPMTGTITSQNKELLNDLSIINTDPYVNGWIYTIKPVNWNLEIQFMSMSEKYQKWLKNEFSRLKDFFTMLDTKEYSYITLQDGGELKDNILSDFGPEVWDDFQTKFIDKTI